MSSNQIELGQVHADSSMDMGSGDSHFPLDHGIDPITLHARQAATRPASTTRVISATRGSQMSTGQAKTPAVRPASATQSKSSAVRQVGAANRSNGSRLQAATRPPIFPQAATRPPTVLPPSYAASTRQPQATPHSVDFVPPVTLTARQLAAYKPMPAALVYNVDLQYRLLEDPIVGTSNMQQTTGVQGVHTDKNIYHSQGSKDDAIQE